MASIIEGALRSLSTDISRMARQRYSISLSLVHATGSHTNCDVAFASALARRVVRHVQAELAAVDIFSISRRLFAAGHHLGLALVEIPRVNANFTPMVYRTGSSSIRLRAGCYGLSDSA